MALATGKEQSVKSNIWLAAEGGYSDKVKSLCTSDPRLRQRDPKATTQKTPWEDSGVRVVTMDMEADGSFRKALEFRHPEKLDVHLSKFSSAPGKRSVYILEESVLDLPLFSEIISPFTRHSFSSMKE